MTTMHNWPIYMKLDWDSIKDELNAAFLMNLRNPTIKYMNPHIIGEKNMSAVTNQAIVTPLKTVGFGDTVKHKCSGNTCTIVAITTKRNANGVVEERYSLKHHYNGLTHDGYERDEFWAAGEEPINYKFNVGDRVYSSVVRDHGTITAQRGLNPYGKPQYNIAFETKTGAGFPHSDWYEDFLTLAPLKPEVIDYKFKVGDRIVHNYAGAGTITKQAGKTYGDIIGYNVKFDKAGYDDGAFWYEKYMVAEPKKVEKPQPKFKVGDTVIVDQKNWRSHYGKVSRVHAPDTNGTIYYDVDTGAGGPIKFIHADDMTSVGTIMTFSEVTNIGWAIQRAKAGKKVARHGWNGKNMWVAYMPDLYLPADKVNERTKQHIGEGVPLDCGAYLVMMTASGVWQPGWLASQADLLATDWYVVE